MSNTSIKLKKSSVSGKIPLVSDIDYGELAINYADGKLYYKHNDTSIRSFLDSGQILFLIDSDYLKSIINSTYIIANRPINLLGEQRDRAALNELPKLLQRKDKPKGLLLDRLPAALAEVKLLGAIRDDFLHFAPCSSLPHCHNVPPVPVLDVSA